jgi:hypothetical protein
MNLFLFIEWAILKLNIHIENLSLGSKRDKNKESKKISWFLVGGYQPTS